MENPEIWVHICESTLLFSPHASLYKAYALEIKKMDYNISAELDRWAWHFIQYRIPDLIGAVMMICAQMGNQ
jgi:hypothetical protein